MIKNNTGMPEQGSNEITRQEKKAARKRERLAKAVAREDERLGIADKKPMTEISSELNQDDTPVENKSFTQYVDATKDPSKVTTVDNQTQETIDYEPGKAVKNAINNVSTNFTGSNVVNDIVNANKDLTFDQVQDLAGRAANVGELKAQQEKENQLTLQTEANALAEQFQQQTGEGVGIQTKETPSGVETTETVTDGGMGVGTTTAPEPRPIGPIVSTKGEPVKPSYEQVATKNQVEQDLATLNQQAMAMDLLTPDAVLEKLDVRDYYPEVGKDIAVGTWTGSVLGSQTIYSGAGTLLPMGLYDARKRAIATAAKQKQDIIDKMVELPNTADQFQRNYQEYGYQNIIEAGLKKHGSYEKMVKDPQWRRDMARFKNLGIELSYADKQADVLLKALGDGKWVPKDVREAAYNLKNGMGDSIDDILNGKTSVLKYTSKLRSYENGTAHIDEAIKNGLFDESRLDEMPMNLKTSEAEANPNDYNAFIKSVNDGSVDNDTYVTGIKKFFDTSKVYGFVDSWIKGNNADPNTRESMVDYMISQIPRKTTLTYHSMGNQSFERYAEANKQRRWAAEFELKKKEQMAHYDMELELMNTPGDDGETYAQKVKKIQGNKKLTEQQKAVEMAKAAAEWGGRGSSRNPYMQTQVFTQNVPSYMQGKQLNMKPAKGFINVQEPKTKKVVKDGKVTYVPIKDSKGQIIYQPKSIPLSEMAKKKPNTFKDVNGKFITLDQIQTIQEALNTDAVFMYPQTQESFLIADDGRGGAQTVTNFNMDKLNLNKTGYGISTYGKALLPSKKVIENGVEVEKPGKELPAGVHFQGLLNDDVERDAMNKNWGKPEKGKEYQNYGSYQTTGSGSSESEYGQQ